MNIMREIMNHKVSPGTGMNRFICCASLGMLLISGVMMSVLSADIVVSTTGSDDHPGTAELPLATLAKAQLLARQQRQAHQQVTIIIRNGVYHIENPLVLDARDSLTTWKSAKGETVVISGGQELSPWQREPDGSWSASALSVMSGEPIRLLRVGKRRAVRARQPNTDFYDGLSSKNYTQIRFPAGQIGSWAKSSGIDFVSILEWASHRHEISPEGAAVDKNELSFPSPVLPLVYKPWAGFLVPSIKKSLYYFEHAREFLDTPGEWWFDRDRHIIRYLPLLDDDIRVPGVVAKLPNIVHIQGSATAPVHRLTFQDMTFSDATWTPPASGFKMQQAGFPGTSTSAILSAAIHAKWLSNSQFTRLSLRHMDGSGLAIDQGCDTIQMDQLSVFDVGGNGIEIGDRITPQQATQAYGVSNCTLSRSLIDNCGWVHPGCVGIWVGLTQRVHIDSCEVRFIPYTGISMGWQWSPGNSYLHLPTFARENAITNTYIHHVMLLMADGGGIYTLGLQPGSRLENNVIHSIPQRIGHAKNTGIYCDEGSSQILIRGNTGFDIQNTMFRFHKAAALNLDNNTFYGKSLYEFVRSKEKDMEIKGNVLHPHQPSSTAALIRQVGPNRQ